MVSYSRKAFFNFAWIAFGTFIASLFGYLLRVLLVRNLTVEEYGLIYATMALFGLVALLQHLGMSEALTKYIAAYLVRKKYASIRDIVRWAIRLIYCTTTILAVSGFFLADWLAVVYFKHPAASLFTKLIAIQFFIAGFGYVLIGIFAGKQRMDLYATYNMSYSVIIFCLVWYFLSIESGVYGVAYAYIISFIPLYIAFLPVISRLLPGLWKRVSFSFSVPKKLLTYSIPVALTALAWTVLSQTDTVLMTLFTTLEEVGIYQVAVPTANILLFISSIVITVFMPLVAELWERKKTHLISTGIQELYLFGFVLVLPLIVAILVYPDLVLNLLFTAEYIKGAPILQVLTIAAIFLILGSVNSASLSGIGKPKENTKVVLVAALFNFLSNLYLIPRYGGLGAACSTLIAALVIFILGTYFLQQHVQVRMPFVQWIKTCLAGGVFFLVLAGSRTAFIGINQYVKVSIAICLAGIAYCTVLWLTRTVTPEDIRTLAKRIAK